MSSITSITSAVIAWREFIAEGLRFYKKIIVDPLIVAFDFIGLCIQQPFVDWLIIYSLIAAALVRTLIAEYRWKRTMQLLGNETEEAAARARILPLVLVLAGISYYLLLVLPFLVLALLGWVWACAALSLLLLVGMRGAFRKSYRADLIYGFTPVAFGITGLFLLAAVNAGL